MTDGRLEVWVLQRIPNLEETIMQRMMIVALLLLLVAHTIPALCEEKWTPEQKEIWAVEEKCWSLNKPTDLEALMSLYHPDYRGWNYLSPLPSGKDQVRKWMGYYMNEGEVAIYDIRPVEIFVRGNVAFAHYYYRIITKDKKGEEKAESGRWTDIFMKEGGKWLCIGDHGGQTSK
jgi:ketosteroid isomerase-like protein